jgi:hypothetical protein
MHEITEGNRAPLCHRYAPGQQIQRSLGQSLIGEDIDARGSGASRNGHGVQPHDFYAKEQQQISDVYHAILVAIFGIVPDPRETLWFALRERVR